MYICIHHQRPVVRRTSGFFCPFARRALSCRQADRHRQTGGEGKNYPMKCCIWHFFL